MLAFLRCSLSCDAIDAVRSESLAHYISGGAYKLNDLQIEVGDSVVARYVLLDGWAWSLACGALGVYIEEVSKWGVALHVLEKLHRHAKAKAGSREGRARFTGRLRNGQIEEKSLAKTRESKRQPQLKGGAVGTARACMRKAS